VIMATTKQSGPEDFLPQLIALIRRTLA
jgi:hypothetical protein